MTNVLFLWPFSQQPLPLCFSDCKSVGLTWESLVYRTLETSVLLFYRILGTWLNVIKIQGSAEYGHSGQVRGTGGEGFLSACC